MRCQASDIIDGDPTDEFLEIHPSTVEAERPAVYEITGKQVVGDS